MAEIPQRKKTADELREVVNHHAFERFSPQSIVQKKILHPVWISVGYLLSLGGLGVLFYPLIVWKRPLSSHHGGFMCFLSLLVALFVGGYYFQQLRVPKRETTERGLDSIPSVWTEEKGSEERGGDKKEMNAEELARYLEELRQENENDPDYKKWIESQSEPEPNAPQKEGLLER